MKIVEVDIEKKSSTIRQRFFSFIQLIVKLQLLITDSKSVVYTSYLIQIPLSSPSVCVYLFTMDKRSSVDLFILYVYLLV